jgi:hypothetical protein
LSLREVDDVRERVAQIDSLVRDPQDGCMSLPHAPVLSKVAKDYVERLTAENGALTPQMLLWIPILVPNAATADIDTVMTEKVEIVDVIVRKDGAGASNTIQAKTGAGTAITDAIAAAVDKAVTRAGTIDTATNVIAAGGTLRITATRAAGTMACLVLVGVLIRP